MILEGSKRSAGRVWGVSLAGKKRGGGPKTAEGKARSRENATRHGLRSGRLRLLGDESAEELAETRANWL